jgi:hypothetical protein
MKTEGTVQVSKKLIQNWTPAFEAYLGKAAVESLSPNRMHLLAGMAAASYAKLTGQEVGLEADMAIMTSDNTSLAMNVQNPTVQGTGINGVQGQKGSGDRQYLVGICIAIAAKTIGLDLVQNVPATSQNVTIKYLNVVYNGGDLNNAANDTVKVVTIGFDKLPGLVAGQKYVIIHTDAAGTGKEGIELTYVKPDRKGVNYAVFTVGNAFTATVSGTAISNITYLTAGPAIGAVVADGTIYSINADMDTLTALTSGAVMESVENTKAVENYIPNQTTKGLRRTLTRSEADAGTEHKVELEMNSDAHVIGNRVFIGNISRLQYKRLQESGVDAIPYLTAGMKNEVSQEINYQIVSAVRAYGLSNALAYAANGSNFNTYIGPASVASINFANLPYANELFDKDMQPVAAKFAAINNLTKTMQYETIASIGTYLAMLITQAAYAIGTDSRFGEGDAVVLSSNLAGYLAASSRFTKLSDKNVDMTASTGAKLSGYVDGIKVYVDVQSPMNSPYVTVLRTNTDVKVDVPGIEGDNILVPGLAYLVKDLISTVTLVPSGTGGNKIILDSETDLIAVGERAEAAYLTFAFAVDLPGLNG